MAFASFAEFIAMGGYGFYVWLSYGATVLALLALVWHGRAAGKQRDQCARCSQPPQAQRQDRSSESHADSSTDEASWRRTKPSRRATSKLGSYGIWPTRTTWGLLRSWTRSCQVPLEVSNQFAQKVASVVWWAGPTVSAGRRKCKVEVRALFNQSFS